MITKNTQETESFVGISSDELCRRIAADCDTAILYFSRGKDSVGSWLQLRRFFKRIVPVFLYHAPGCQFIDDSIGYYERFFGTKIVSLPHPWLYRQLNRLTLQPPARIQSIIDFRLPDFDYSDVRRILIEDYDLPQNAWAAVGCRLHDSLNRLASIRKYGPANRNRNQFYPIYDWNKDRLFSEISGSKVKLPCDYHVWGRSFDGLGYHYIEPMRRLLPRDYEVTRQWFPFADAVFARKEFRDANQPF